MASGKKKRHRGSRTHGGGSHKNRRGAGNRGGRGDAGRSKHERHNHSPLGKRGFTPPQGSQPSVKEINLQKLDENAALLVADGLAERKDDGFYIDAREVAEDGYGVDQVKVLGNGQVRQELHVVADRFSSRAIGLLENEGGEAELSERSYLHEDVSGMLLQSERYSGRNNIKVLDLNIENMGNIDQEHVQRRVAEVSQGKSLDNREISQLLDIGDNSEDSGLLYDISVRGYENKDEISPDDVIGLYQMESYAEEHGLDTTNVEELAEGFFSDVDTSESAVEEAQKGVEGSVHVEDAEEGLAYLNNSWDDLKQVAAEKEGTLPERRLERTKKSYLLGIRNSFERYT